MLLVLWFLLPRMEQLVISALWGTFVLEEQRKTEDCHVLEDSSFHTQEQSQLTNVHNAHLDTFAILSD